MTTFEHIYFGIAAIYLYLVHMIYRCFYSIVLLACVLGINAFSAYEVFAASSKWFETAGAKMRLITATRPDNQKIDAALEIYLEKGWKTYWRSPGDSGIPPTFDFSGSTNVANATVLYPTPSYFKEQGAHIVGYKDHVVFPINLQIGAFGKKTELNMKAIIGICGEVCIPVQAQLSVSESGNSGPTFDISRALTDAVASVPSRPQPDMRIINAKWSKDDPEKLTINARVLEDSAKVELHVEGPQDWYLLPANLEGRNGNSAQFVLNLTDLPENANPATTNFRFTLVADGLGIEQELIPNQQP